MTDKIIINTISKIHFTIVSFFIFIFFSLSIFFLLFQDGISFDKIQLANLKVEQLYIKWDRKLVITAKNIIIDTTQKNDTTTMKLEEVQSLIKKVDFALGFVENITFSNIIYNDTFMNFSYSTQDGGTFSAHAKSFDINSTFYYDKESLHLLLHDFAYKHAKIYGEITLFANLHKAHTALYLEVSDDTIIDINIHSDREYLNYTLVAHKNIHNIKEILALVEFPKEVRYWVDDAISLDSLEIVELSGRLSYENPEEFYKHIYAKAIAHKLQYLYNPKLDSIDSLATHLEFKEGVLYIRPEMGTSYGFDLQESWLKIDFTKPQEILTLFLLFDGVLSKDVVTILNTYNIPIPFLQKKGIAKTNLKIEVNLHTIAIDALGRFQTENANFDFFDFNFDVAHADIILNNYDLIINAHDANHQDLVIADVQTTLNMKKLEGDIGLSFKKITDPSNSLINTKPFDATYKLSKGKDSLLLSPSSWRLLETDFDIEQTDIAIDFETLSGVIPKTKISLPNNAYIEVSGTGSLKDKSLSSIVNLFNPSFSSVTSPQKYIPMRLSYKDDTLQLSTQRDTLLSYENQKIWIEKTRLIFKNSTLSIPRTSFKLDTILEFQLQGNYNFSKGVGALKTQKLLLKDKNKNPLLKYDMSLNIDLKKDKNSFVATAEELQLFATHNNISWSFEAKKLDKLLTFSPPLRDYNLTNGHFRASQKSTQKHINFSLQTEYPYELLLDNNQHIKSYNITGSYQANSIKADINKKISLYYDEKLKIHAKDVGIDIFTLLDFIETITAKEKSKTPLDILVSATNSYLYLNKERRIIADTMELNNTKDGLKASLKHEKAQAHLDYDDDKQFMLYGENFSDTFLEQLFSYSKFQDAKLGFSLNGSIKDFKGVIYLKDSTIKDYKIINNVLAFVNTIPSLVTFSLPGYSNTGLFVSNGYVKFHAKDFLFDISDILLQSKEISILGKGKIDYNKDEVDLEINLKTDLASSVSQIPIIGYILFDKKSISTTVSVKGTLQEQEVSSLLAKEIIVAPFNIIKRTFLLPFHLLSDEKDE